MGVTSEEAKKIDAYRCSKYVSHTVHRFTIVYRWLVKSILAHEMCFVNLIYVNKGIIEFHSVKDGSMHNREVDFVHFVP